MVFELLNHGLRPRFSRAARFDGRRRLLHLRRLSLDSGITDNRLRQSHGLRVHLVETSVLACQEMPDVTASPRRIHGPRRRTR